MNYIFALPSDSTADFMRQLFQASPMEIDFEGLAVCLGTTYTNVPLKDEPLRAIAGSIGIWYDPIAGFSRLLLPLFPSTEMVKRHSEIGDVWQRKFVPYVVLSNAPTNKRRHKGFINSIATALVDTNQELVFDTEAQILINDSDTPPDNEFYKASIGQGMLSNQVFLEEDEGIS